MARFWHGMRVKHHVSSQGAKAHAHGNAHLEAGPTVHAHTSSARAHTTTEHASMAHVQHHSNMNPAVEEAARHSDYPDVDVYDRPATTRMTTANLDLSIVILVAAVIAVGVILWAVFR